MPTLGFTLNERYELWQSKNCRLGESSIRIVPFVSGVYPDVPPSGMTFTLRRELEIATGLPPLWYLLFDGTIDIVSKNNIESFVMLYLT